MDISVSLNGEIFEQVIYAREDAFEQLVAENAQTIFGDKAIYIDAKKKLNTSFLGGTIPDGFLIDLSDKDDPQFYLVEVELQSHDFSRHIQPQINKFITSCRNTSHRHEIVDILFPIVEDKIRKLIGSIEVYKLLKNTIDNSQNILIIIDGPKPEFKEQMETHTEWREMVNVQIINHFKKGENNILTVAPPFVRFQFGDAILSFPEKRETKDTKYPEEFHLKGCNESVKDIYCRLKTEFLSIDSTLQFNSVQKYIGVRNNMRNIAGIYVKQKFLWVRFLLADNVVNTILVSKHNKVKVYSPGSCFVQINDTLHWNEIQKLVIRLVQKYQDL